MTDRCGCGDCETCEIAAELADERYLIARLRAENERVLEAENKAWREAERWKDQAVELRAENEALVEAHRSIWTYLNISGDQTHENVGAACGVDACIVCLAKETAKHAVTRAQESRGPIDEEGSTRG